MAPLNVRSFSIVSEFWSKFDRQRGDSRIEIARFRKSFLANGPIGSFREPSLLTRYEANASKSKDQPKLVGGSPQKVIRTAAEKEPPRRQTRQLCLSRSRAAGAGRRQSRIDFQGVASRATPAAAAPTQSGGGVAGYRTRAH